ncbi:MAG: hypothetical protein FJ279_02185 [Planctomycetes bacterium]|nr:hypothetical protein [Planctomycetota bacterium]
MMSDAQWRATMAEVWSCLASMAEDLAASFARYGERAAEMRNRTCARDYRARVEALMREAGAELPIDCAATQECVEAISAEARNGGD